MSTDHEGDIKQYHPGQEVEWMMRPLVNGDSLKGIVIKIGSSKIKIKVQSPKTGEWRETWVHPLSLREIPKESGSEGVV